MAHRARKLYGQMSWGQVFMVLYTRPISWKENRSKFSCVKIWGLRMNPREPCFRFVKRSWREILSHLAIFTAHKRNRSVTGIRHGRRLGTGAGYRKLMEEVIRAGAIIKHLSQVDIDKTRQGLQPMDNRPSSQPQNSFLNDKPKVQ